MLSRSVFVRCAILIIACTSVVAATISFMSYRSSNLHVIESAQNKAGLITQIVAQESGGAIRFGKSADLTNLFEKAISNLEGAAYGVLAIGSDGSLVASTEGLEPAQLTDLATRAIDTNSIVRSPDGLHLGVPVYFGKDNAVIGAIAMAWTAEESLARIRKDNFIALGSAAGMLFVAVCVALFLLSRSLVRPLVALRDAVHQLSDGDYGQSVSLGSRRDEIGQIGTAVESLRQVLQAAEGLRVETTFKGAGYESSSTAAMLVDQAFTVQYLNASARRIINDFASHLGVEQASGAIGMVVRDLHPTLSELQSMTETSDGSSVTMDVEMGPNRFSVSINEIRNTDNVLTGFVMEWHDVTEQRILTAIRHCIDDAQCEVRLSSTGTLDAANGVFCESVGMQVSALKGRTLNSLFQPEIETGARAPFWTAISSGESVSGRFKVAAQPENVRLIEGDFKPILDDQGTVVNAVFLGKDITEQDARIQTAENLRMKLETEQRVAMDGIREALGTLAAGDLSVQMRVPFAEAYEQLRADFNSASRQLCIALGDVNENSTSIGAGVTALTAAADQLASRTERQAATLEQTAAALDELTVSVKAAAAGAEAADGVVNSTKGNAQQGEQVVGEAIKAMNEIEASSGQISKIISVIDDIAFQTNLLALNAGVEAARAGEAGRGFAVVASEVRALAQRSSEAASEIDQLISSSSQQVKRGVDLVGQTGAALHKILGSVSSVATIVSEIAESSSQQSNGLSEINTSMMDLDQVTQQNAAMFEETNAMAQSLSESVQVLAEAVAQFRTEIPEGGDEWHENGASHDDLREVG